jgi:hypothetical protein
VTERWVSATPGRAFSAAVVLHVATAYIAWRLIVTADGGLLTDSLFIRWCVPIAALTALIAALGIRWMLSRRWRRVGHAVLAAVAVGCAVETVGVFTYLVATQR